MGHRQQLRRDLRRLAADRGGVELVHGGRHPLRKVRVGDRVQVRAGEVLTIVDETGEIPLGHVQAAAAGVFTLEADAAKIAAKAAAGAQP